MRICDLKPEEIVVGLRLKRLDNDIWGTVVKIDDDGWRSIQWDGESTIESGFWENDCKCLVEKR